MFQHYTGPTFVHPAWIKNQQEIDRKPAPGFHAWLRHFDDAWIQKRSGKLDLDAYAASIRDRLEQEGSYYDAVQVNWWPSFLSLRTAFQSTWNTEKLFLQAHVRGLEMSTALELGFLPEQVILNGPAKGWPNPIGTHPVHAIFCDSLDELRQVVQRPEAWLADPGCGAPVFGSHCNRDRCNGPVVAILRIADAERTVPSLLLVTPSGTAGAAFEPAINSPPIAEHHKKTRKP